MSTLDCIEAVLRKAGRAMSVAELLPLMRESAGGGGAAEGKPPQPVAQPPRRDDLGFFYILANDAFDGKWCKVLMSYKPIDPNGEEVDDPALPVAYRVISAYKTRPLEIGIML